MILSDGLNVKRFTLTAGFLIASGLFAEPENFAIENLGGFVAGTIIQTSDGPDTIQSIRVNDRVLSFDLITGKIVESRVIDVFQEEINELVRLVVADEEYHVNPDHRLYDANSHEWVHARLLVPGTHFLLSKDGNKLPINKAELIGGRTFIYDFSVEDTENYFVGKQKLLVHNFAFVVPVATWVMGEGIVFMSAATVAAVAATYAVDYGLRQVSALVSRDTFGLDRFYQPSSRHDWDLAVEQTGAGRTWVNPFQRNRLAPDDRAAGDHTTFRPRPEGGIDHYETWKEKGPNQHPKDPHRWKSDKRFDGDGASHRNKETGEKIETPHVHDPNTIGGIRRALPSELPK